MYLSAKPTANSYWSAADPAVGSKPREMLTTVN
jgi:hypothetical protein